jgi:hypothetical protein
VDFSDRIRMLCEGDLRKSAEPQIIVHKVSDFMPMLRLRYQIRIVRSSGLINSLKEKGRLSTGVVLPERSVMNSEDSSRELEPVTINFVFFCS